MNMFGKRVRFTVFVSLLLVLVMMLCSCSGLVEVFIQIVNDHTGTIFFSIFNASGQGLKIYSGVPMQTGGTTKVTLEQAEGYYLLFTANIGGLNHFWVEEIGGVETHDIPWVNGKTYHIGDLSIGEWQLIM